MFNKVQVRWIMLVAVILLVGFGIYLNPDRRIRKVNAELERIMTSMNSTMLEIRDDVATNQSCFEDESLQNGASAGCVISLRAIQETLRNTDKENMGKLEKYYQDNKAELDDATKSMINNSLRLYQSNSYSDLLDAYDRYFTANIKWHTFFRDVVGIKGVDNMTNTELMNTKSLAQEVVSAEENLKLKTNTFSDYLHTNFDKEFVQSLTKYVESLKK